MFLIAGGDGMLGGGLGTSFVSIIGIKLGAKYGSVGGTMVGLAGGYIYV